MLQISPSVSGVQNTSKVAKQSLKDYVNIKSLNSDDFAEWLRLQDVVGIEVIQAFKGNNYSIEKCLHELFKLLFIFVITIQ